MSDQTYTRLNAFEAAGGTYRLEPTILYSMKLPVVGWWECSLKYKDILINEAQGATPDGAIFLAFDILHTALPQGVIKW